MVDVSELVATGAGGFAFQLGGIEAGSTKRQNVDRVLDAERSKVCNGRHAGALHFTDQEWQIVGEAVIRQEKSWDVRIGADVVQVLLEGIKDGLNGWWSRSMAMEIPVRWVALPPMTFLVGRA